MILYLNYQAVMKCCRAVKTTTCKRIPCQCSAEWQIVYLGWKDQLNVFSISLFSRCIQCAHADWRVVSAKCHYFRQITALWKGMQCCHWKYDLLIWRRGYSTCIRWIVQTELRRHELDKSENKRIETWRKMWSSNVWHEWETAIDGWIWSLTIREETSSGSVQEWHFYARSFWVEWWIVWIWTSDRWVS